MANYYVWSGATGTADGSSWANAYVRLRLAMTARLAGDTFFVAHDHAETEAVAMTIASPGTEAAPCRIYCVNRAGSVPPVSADLRTTATVTTTSTSNIVMTGSVSECYGIIFNGGTGGSGMSVSVSNSAGRTWKLVNCQVKMVSTAAAGRIILASAGGTCILENTSVSFANASQGIRPDGRIIWKNLSTAAVTGTMPTGGLFVLPTAAHEIFMEGLDLSSVSGGPLFLGGGNFFSRCIVKDCKIAGSNIITTANITGFGGNDISIIRSDSGDTNYRAERYTYMGTQTTETTIVRTGGASDGTTPIAWKIVTTANAEKEFPFESLPITVWNETLSSITVTVEGIWGGGAVPNNDDIWIDVEYLATSGTCRGSKATSGKANALAAGAAIPAGSGTWGGSTTKFAMSATITPAEKGPITIYVRAGAVSSTFYVDPKPVIT